MGYDLDHDPLARKYMSCIRCEEMTEAAAIADVVLCDDCTEKILIEWIEKFYDFGISPSDTNRTC